MCKIPFEHRYLNKPFLVGVFFLSENKFRVHSPELSEIGKSEDINVDCIRVSGSRSTSYGEFTKTSNQIEVTKTIKVESTIDYNGLVLSFPNINFNTILSKMSNSTFKLLAVE